MVLNYGYITQRIQFRKKSIVFWKDVFNFFKRIEELWFGTTYALSGLFCSSLEFMHRTDLGNQFSIPFRPESQTSSPSELFKPHLFNQSESEESLKERMKHSILSGETVCTENLTPWIKFLPCRSHSGLASLLSHPNVLYALDYHSLGIHFIPATQLNEKKLYLTLTLVVNRFSIQKSPQISHSNPKSNDENFNLLNFFQMEKNISSCPLAKSSLIYISQSLNSDYQVQVPKIYLETNLIEEQITQKRLFSVYNLIPFYHRPDFNLTWNNKLITKPQKNNQNIRIDRWILGLGLQSGKLVLEIQNSLSSTVNITYYQVTPWFMRLYFHSTKIQLGNGKSHFGPPLSEFELETFKIKFEVSPAIDRISTSKTSLKMTLGPQSKVLLTIDFDSAFLCWAEYSPDSHRGFDLSPGILLVELSPETANNLLDLRNDDGRIISFDGLTSQLFQSSNSNLKKIFRIYTNPLVLTLPNPDFSMPYNVVTLTSTAIALFLSSTLAILTRKYRDLHNEEGFKSDRPIFKLLNFLKKKFSK